MNWGWLKLVFNLWGAGWLAACLVFFFVIARQTRGPARTVLLLTAPGTLLLAPLTVIFVILNHDRINRLVASRSSKSPQPAPSPAPEHSEAATKIVIALLKAGEAAREARRAAAAAQTDLDPPEPHEYFGKKAN